MLLMLVPLAVVLVVSVRLDFRSSLAPTMAAFDAALINSALGLAGQIRLDGNALVLRLDSQAEQLLRSDTADVVIWALYDNVGLLAGGDRRLPLPITLEGERQVYNATVDGRQVRVARVTRITELGPAHVLVGETYNKRDDSERRILNDQVLPNVLLIAVTLGIVVLAIGAALKPLEQLRADIAGRTARDLHPIDVDAVPVDSRPVVESLNRLFESLRRAEQTQRAFLANAAHQLRTPVTGLTTQIELAQIEGAFDATPERAERLQQGLDQLRQLLDQLLTLSRAEAFGSSAPRFSTVDIKALLEQQAGLFIDRAVARGIDLGYALVPCRTRGVDWLLRELAGNLIDNALRYTPAGGEVTVSCGEDQDGPWLAVEDTGPGISTEDRERVFERFWRGESSRQPGSEAVQGSGLGMAIVREIAEQHRARVEISEARQRTGGNLSPGTRVLVRLPHAASPAQYQPALQPD